MLLSLTGAVFTTDSTCADVNHNIYAAKSDVYVNGGPAKPGAAGLPDGDYYVRVTDPSGKVVLGSTPGADVTVVDGEFVDCYQLTTILKTPGGSTGYNDTPNPGYEYKVWVSSDSSFSNSNSKTDNFKVKPTRRAPSICGVKFNDHNGNGLRDSGDEGLSGWTIFLDANGNGVLDRNDANGNGCWDGPSEGEQWTTTSNHGAYSFTGLAAGTYKVIEVLTSGWCQTAPQADGDTYTANNLVGYVVTVNTGDQCDSRDFGNFQKVRIKGTKYNDANGDGQTTGDKGLANWTIVLDNDTDATNGNIRTTTTDSYGCYTFSNLAPGTYYIYEVLKDSWQQTKPSSGSGVVSITGNGKGYCVTVGGDGQQSGQDCLRKDFANFKLGTIKGKKFCDADADGIFDSDEHGIEGVRIFLDQDGDKKLDWTDDSTTPNGQWDPGEGERWVRTDSNGCYQFDNLPLGCYYVCEEVPSNQVPTTPTCVKVDFNESCSLPHCFTVNFGDVLLGGGGGRTLGFWSNKNGFALMNDGSSIESELALLRSLNLRNANGSNFDPTTYDQFRSWLLSATATNMAYMLSAQLAAMELNVEAGLVDGDAAVYAPGTPGATSLGFTTINNLMTQANSSLGANGYTPSGSSARTLQGKLKDALDAANNNRNFVIC
jgi:hypothetical protein